MRLKIVLLWLLSGALMTGTHAVIAAPTVTSKPTVLHATMTQFGRFGVVRLFQPMQSIKNVVVLASGDGRWDDPLMTRMAQLLVDQGTAVIGIDTVAYLQEVSDTSDQCIYMGGDFEDLAHAMEKQLNVQRYMAPVLMGYSSGASLVYAVLAQTPRGMFQAGMSVGFCNELSLQISLCSGRGNINEPLKSADGPSSLLLPLRQLSARWVVLQGEQDDICKVDTARQFSAQVTAAQLRTLPNVGHFFEGTRDWRDAFINAYQSLQPAPMPIGLPPEVRDLPVTEVPSRRPGDELAILLTGDGGWAELDQEVARELSNAGISVVALSSLQYFWHARTPQQAAKDLSRLMAHYSQVWQRPKIRLLGYSFGADVLPAVTNALPAADRARIVSVGLLSLLPRTSFEIHVAGWLGKVVGEEPVLPELQKLAAAEIPVTCVYGRDDEDTLCRELPANLAHVVALPGGHDCNDDHAAIVRAWLSGWPVSSPTPRGAQAVRPLPVTSLHADIGSGIHSPAMHSPGGWTNRTSNDAHAVKPTQL